MTHFLQNLDQWALQILMVIYNLLGVQDLPKQPDPHWQVIERWAPQPEGHYRLILESTTIQEECRSGRAKYIIFPQTYLGRQQVFADTVRVYSNELDNEWHLSTVADRPVINCDLFKNATKIRFVNDSFVSFYSSIYNWPVGAKTYPKDQFLYNPLYFALSLSILFLTAVGSISLKMASANPGPFYRFGLASSLLVFTQTPGVIISIDIQVCQILFLVGLFYSAFFLLIEYISINKEYEFLIHFLFIFLALSLFGQRNLTHIVILVSALSSLFFILTIIILKRTTAKLSSLALGVVFIMGVKDFYQSQVSRSSYVGVSSLAMAILCLIFYRLMWQANTSRKQIVEFQKNVEVNKKVLVKTSQINSRMKQFIHDMKAPLTALNFALSNSSVDVKSIKLSIKRINDLFNYQMPEKEDAGLDWHSMDLLVRILKEFEQEKRNNLNRVVINVNAIEQYMNHKIFYDPQQIRGFIFELIHNACRVNEGREITFQMKLYFNDNYLVLECADDGVAYFDGNINNLGLKGYSKFGSGLGLSSIVQKLENWGGEVHFQKKIDSFSIFIMMQQRPND